MATERMWLRRRGTINVQQWNQFLAQDKDVYPVSEEEARRCQEEQVRFCAENAAAKRGGMATGPIQQTASEAAAEHGLIPGDDGSARKRRGKKQLGQMTREELYRFCGDNKMMVRDGMSREDLLTEIQQLMAASMPRTMPNPDQKVAHEETPREELSAMAYEELLARGQQVGVSQPRKMKRADLEAAIRAVGGGGDEQRDGDNGGAGPAA